MNNDNTFKRTYVCLKHPTPYNYEPFECDWCEKEKNITETKAELEELKAEIDSVSAEINQSKAALESAELALDELKELYDRVSGKL